MSKPPYRLGVVMDPIETIVPKKDSTLAMLLEAGRRKVEVHYMLQGDLRLLGGRAIAHSRLLTVRDDPANWFSIGESRDIELGDLDAILMRKDPPFDMEYIYTSYILERAEVAGALIVNKPESLRDMNEKAYTAWFPDCAPLTLISRRKAEIRAFHREHGKIVIKPLDGMGGRSVFVVREDDNNANVIIETLTDNGRRYAVAQVYIPEISAGDKRVLLVDGEAVPYSLARIPPADDNRGNLVMGAIGEGRPLSDRDRAIAARVGPALAERGVIFAGIDVIGDYLTEINVTSPTGIVAIDKYNGTNTPGMIWDALERRHAEM